MRESSHRLEKPEHEDIKATAPEGEKEADTKFAGGKPPPVGAAFNDHASASNMAYAEDDNERELKEKVGRLVATTYGGDFKKAFEHYDHDKNGAVGKNELVALLSDAGVGNGITRGVWASKIIEKLDQDGDAAIQWAEFESVFRASA